MSGKLSNQEVVTRMTTKFPMFDYSNVDYQGPSKAITVGCKIHGNFKIKFPTILLCKHPCPKCREKSNMEWNGKHTTEKVIANLKAKYGDTYDYSKVEYVNARTPIVLIDSNNREIRGIYRSIIKQIPTYN